jgi:uncharacterized circularly permuted ATP-grasp superfamily protein
MNSENGQNCNEMLDPQGGINQAYSQYRDWYDKQDPR